jgi:hypothetical protein
LSGEGSGECEGVIVSLIVRILLALIGGFAVLVGMVLWAAENEYGSDAPDFTIETGPRENHSIVYAIGPSQGRLKVFEGTPAEALAYATQQSEQAGGRTFLTAGLTIAAGGLLVIGAIVWPRRAKSRSEASV